MTEYTIFFYGEPKFQTPESGKEHMTKYMAWMSTVGDKFVNPGTPLGQAEVIGHADMENVEAKKLTGYAIIKGETKEEVIEIVKKCPFLDFGFIKVSENKQMRR
jgi:hypothetical protein